MGVAQERSRARTGVEADEVFSIEQHGINPIPVGDRHGSPRELFGVWFGANLIFTYVIFGALSVSFGVSFWPAVIALVLGNLAFVLVGLGAIAGPRSGSPTFINARAVFGPRGNIPAVAAGWLTIMGFGVVNAVVGTLSLQQLAQEVGLPTGDGVMAVCLAVVLTVTFAVAVWGHATVAFLERWLGIALAVGAVVLAVLVLPDADLAARPESGDTSAFGAWLLALFIFLSGPFSYLNVPADYARYLRPRTPGRPIALWTALGAMIPAVLLGLIGIAAATATDMTDPVAGLAELVPSWFLVPFLAIVVGGAITNNILGLYSSGLNLQVMGLPLARWRTMFVVAAVITAGAVFALFISDFTTSLTNFLSLMILWVAPWGAIFLVDLFLRRGTYDVGALHRTGPGPYWYRAGWNPRALAALGLGIAVAALFANSTLWQGPLTDLIGGGDLSVQLGFLVAGIAYFVLMRDTIARQRAAAQPETAGSAAPVTEHLEPVPGSA